MNTLWPQHVLPEDLVFLQNKKVLVRVDWNMPVTDGVVTDTSRLDVTIPFLLALTQVAKVILVTHFGEKGESLSPVASLASTKLPSLTFTTSKNFDELRSASDSLNVGEVLLLENVRLFEGETDGSELLAKDLATLGEVFINNAFSVAHRKHASVTGIPRFLPSYFGPTFTHEIENLSKALTPVQPALLIVGGAKISTKLALIKQYLDQGVQVFVGGAMVHNILKERGLEIGKSLYDETYKLPEGFATHPLLVTPSDVVLADGTTVEVTQVPADGVIVDCGKKTSKEI
jgi:3-phosphoglycerate kinase